MWARAIAREAVHAAGLAHNALRLENVWLTSRDDRAARAKLSLARERAATDGDADGADDDADEAAAASADDALLADKAREI